MCPPARAQAAKRHLNRIAFSEPGFAIGNIDRFIILARIARSICGPKAGSDAPLQSRSRLITRSSAIPVCSHRFSGGINSHTTAQRRETTRPPKRKCSTCQKPRQAPQSEISPQADPEGCGSFRLVPSASRATRRSGRFDRRARPAAQAYRASAPQFS